MHGPLNPGALLGCIPHEITLDQGHSCLMFHGLAAEAYVKLEAVSRNFWC